jgi:hypothetical protein
MIMLPRAGAHARTHTISSRHHGRIGTLLGAVLIATATTACSGATNQPPQSASVAPSAATSAAPSASPSPSVDVAKVFVERIALTRSGTLDVSGELTFGPFSGDVSGEMAFDGSNSQSRITIDLAGTEQTMENIRLGGEAWNKTASGPWLVDDTPARDQTLTEFLSALLTVEDEGVETRDGRELHRLVPDGGSDISPAALGIDTQQMKDPSVGLVFFAEPDGTPALMSFEVRWSQGAGGVELPATMTMDFAFADIGEAPVIEPPDDVWETFTSDAAGYSMAHPAGWTVDSKDGEDAYQLDGQGYVYVYSQRLPRGMDPGAFHDELVREYRADFGTPADSDEEVQLDGQPAHRLLYHFTNDHDIDVALVDYVIANGRTGYEIVLATAAGAGEEADIELFETFVATFAFLP